MRNCQVFNLPAPPLLANILDLCAGRFGPGKALPDPDLIIGAGHHTHIPILCAKRARGGASVVIMKPSLPTSWFDLCLIPSHDQPPQQQNVISTMGALTNILPSTLKDENCGLLLIGGPSRHFSWDLPALIKQIETIVSKAPTQWQLTDSPRTPISARHAFSKLSKFNLKYTPFAQTSRAWLEERLSGAAYVWVTEDSISMVSEAIASGAGVGLLSMPAKKQGKVTTLMQEFYDSGRVSTYAAWADGARLVPASNHINESERCASFILEQINKNN